MKNNRFKRGFTLIELLAVIIVLAIIMVFAVPQILDSMNNAKKKSFQMYGQRLIQSAQAKYESQLLLGSTTGNKTHKNGAASELCYDFDSLGIESHGTYKGFVVVHPSTEIGDNGLTKTSYNIYLTDESFAYFNTPSDDVLNNPEKISIKADDVQKVKAEKCEGAAPATPAET